MKTEYWPSAEKFRCKCGGTIVIDDANKRSAHSLPECELYRRLISQGILEGHCKYHGRHDIIVEGERGKS